MLALLASNEPANNLLLLRALLNPRSREWRDPRLGAHVPQRRELARDSGFVDLATTFARASVIVVPLTAKRHHRRIIKLQWDEELGPQAERWPRRLGRQLGFIPTVASLDVPQVGGSQAHHFQVDTPPEIEMTMARVRAEAPRRVLHGAIFDRDPPPTSQAEIYDHLAPGFRRRAHLYLRDCYDSRAGALRVGLRAERGGFALGAVLASLLIAGILWIYVIAADSIVDQASSAAAALLLLPGLLAAYIVRPGEHLLARKLHLLARGCLAFDGFIAFLAAAALVALGPRSPWGEQSPDLTAPTDLLAVWWASAVAATLIFALLALGWWLPRPVKVAGPPRVRRA
jgi:hypothetical protein